MHKSKQSWESKILEQECEFKIINNTKKMLRFHFTRSIVSGKEQRSEVGKAGHIDTKYTGSNVIHSKCYFRS